MTIKIYWAVDSTEIDATMAAIWRRRERLGVVERQRFDRTMEALVAEGERCPADLVTTWTSPPTPDGRVTIHCGPTDRLLDMAFPAAEAAALIPPAGKVRPARRLWARAWRGLRLALRSVAP